jgi:beta-1,4-N-acetylglucosaminyltransferase
VPCDIEKTANLAIWRVKRAREVKQSYLTSVFTTLVALVHSALIVTRCRVDLIVTNGPGTAVPLVLSNWALAKILGWRSQTLFIESFCRVKSLSLSGKILKRFADKFIVHWPELKAQHPDVTYFPNFKLI